MPRLADAPHALPESRFSGRVRHFTTVDSTNQVARQLGQSGEPDGTVVRRYTLPALGIVQGDEVAVRDVQCVWSPEQPEVVVQTREGIIVDLLVKDRLLDISSARLGIADELGERYDKAYGADAFRKRVEAAGGYFGFLGELQAMLEEGDG